MIFTKARTYKDITSELTKQNKITIISCTSCARTAGTGGEEVMKGLALKLRKDGYQVLDGYTINTVCTPKVLQARINKNADTIISMACSAGTSNVKELFSGYKIVETTYDVGLMMGDNKAGLVKVEKTYETCNAESGKAFEMLSGIPAEEKAEVEK